MLDWPSPRHFRTIFISDVHLGCRGCQAGLLLDFLRYHDAESIYLVGDIVDGWRLKKGWYWPQEHNDVVQKLLRKVRKGSRVVYVPGNHDEFLRDYVGSSFGGVEVVDRAIHETADGRKLLVIHGDMFDVVVRHAAWVAHLGAGAYNAVLAINTGFNRIRRRMGLGYWSLSRLDQAQGQERGQLYRRASRMRSPTRPGGSAPTASSAAISITPRINEAGGFRYVNAGDWVESCTAIVEHHNGRLEIIRWTEMRGPLDAADDDDQPVLAKATA